MKKEQEKAAVLVTRPLAQSLAIVPDIEKIGFSAHVAPLLNIIPVNHELPASFHEAGLIFTSVHAVEHFKFPNPSFLHCPVYTVGSKTSAALQKKGYTNIIHIAETGKDLQKYLEEHVKGLPEHIFHICGKHIAERFRLPLKNIERIIVYKAEKVNNFTENLREDSYKF